MNKESIDGALRAIRAIVAVPEVGGTYEGKISSVMPYGVFVEFMPGKDGLLHISEMDWRRLETVEETGLREGDNVTVKLVDIDPKTGKFRLSRRELLPKPEGYESSGNSGNSGRMQRPPRNEGRDGRDRDRDRDGRDRDGRGGGGNRFRR